MKSTDLISVFCRPVPFWSWNDKLEPDELRRQIGAMQDAGMGGFFMHARGGLETEYLSEDWFRAVEASVDEAKKRGMQAWCYDENGWPSGFAGGKLLEDPENRAHYLRFEKKPGFDAAAIGVYTLVPVTQLPSDRSHRRGEPALHADVVLCGCDAVLRV